MADERRQLDPVEELLLDLGTADNGGVFRRTRVDARTLLVQEHAVGSSGVRRVTLRLLPVAACLAMAFGVWGWMFNSQLNELRERKLAAANQTTTIRVAAVDFSSCLNGPSHGALAYDCREHDYDADGDVDLADFSAYQLAFAGFSH